MWLFRKAAWLKVSGFLRSLNSPVSSESGSSELMCCGLACLRLDMMQPSGAKSRRQFSSASSTNSSPWKKKNHPPSLSSRNAHVNVIIIINNALRFIAGSRTADWLRSKGSHIIQMVPIDEPGGVAGGGVARSASGRAQGWEAGSIIFHFSLLGFFSLCFIKHAGYCNTGELETSQTHKNE